MVSVSQNKLSIILIVSCIFCYFFVFSQNVSIDVLENNLKKAEKENKSSDICQNLISIADYYAQKNEKRKATKYYKKAIEKSELENLTKEQVLANYHYGLYYYQLEDLNNTKNYLEKALQIAKTKKIIDYVSEIQSKLN